ncbi:hypothetical protein E2C01_082378 [Portunus trituberculatus]|uniref:Uncharacterized protein n=1 Tax=Portunus trituberculatus TaxID=210409 RepID=A0A5B7IYB6_PORTR|nr:hypothetical protein [Portunus trituberculatus]
MLECRGAEVLRCWSVEVCWSFEMLGCGVARVLGHSGAALRVWGELVYIVVLPVACTMVLGLKGGVAAGCAVLHGLLV